MEWAAFCVVRAAVRSHAGRACAGNPIRPVHPRRYVLTRQHLGGLKALFVVAVALAAGCSPGAGTGRGDQRPVVQERTFDVTGFGKLEPEMSKQDVLASGELVATGAGKSGTCEDYRYQGAPARDAGELADETAAEQQLEAAQKAADEAGAAVGPMPDANAGAAAFAAHAAKAAASAEAGAKAAELAAASAQRIAKRAETREANGGVLFTGDRIRLVVPPPEVKSAKGIAAGATVDDVEAAYPASRQRDEKTWDVPVPDQPGTVLSFHFADGKLVTFLLFNADAKCS